MLKINTDFANSMRVPKEFDKLIDSACTVHDASPSNKYQTNVKKMEQNLSSFDLPPKINKRSAFKRMLSPKVIKEGLNLRRMSQAPGNIFSPQV